MTCNIYIYTYIYIVQFGGFCWFKNRKLNLFLENSSKGENNLLPLFLDLSCSIFLVVGDENPTYHQYMDYVKKKLIR